MEKDLKSWWDELKKDFSIYLDAKTQLTKIQVYEKIAKVVGVVISFFVLALLVIFVIAFVLIMIGSWVTALTGSVSIGMSSVAMILIISFALLAIKRKTWLEHPITNSVIDALYDEDSPHEKTKDENGIK